MHRQLSTDEKRAIRQCLHHYVDLRRKLKSGFDVTEELKDEFERARFSPVFLLSRADAASRHIASCAVCGVAEHPKKPDAPLDEIAAVQELQAAAEYYLGLGPGIIENAELQSALKNVIVAHWHALHADNHRAAA
jgi:hypothetical protein